MIVSTKDVLRAQGPRSPEEPVQTVPSGDPEWDVPAVRQCQQAGLPNVHSVAPPDAGAGGGQRPQPHRVLHLDDQIPILKTG